MNIKLKCIVLMLLCLITSGCIHPLSRMNMADFYLQKGDNDSAIEQWQKIIDEYPNTDFAKDAEKYILEIKYPSKYKQKKSEDIFKNATTDKPITTKKQLYECVLFMNDILSYRYKYIKFISDKEYYFDQDLKLGCFDTSSDFIRYNKAPYLDEYKCSVIIKYKYNINNDSDISNTLIKSPFTYQFYANHGCDLVNVSLSGLTENLDYNTKDIISYNNMLYGKLTTNQSDIIVYTQGYNRFSEKKIKNINTIYLANGKEYKSIDELINSKTILSTTSIPLKDSFRKYLKDEERSKYSNHFSNATSPQQLTSFINFYAGYYDPDNLIPKAKIKLKQALLTEYRNAFKNAYSSSDLTSFAHKYAKNDPDRLVPKAKAKISAALKREAEERRAEAARREREASRSSYSSSNSSSKSCDFITVNFDVVAGFSTQGVDRVFTMSPVDSATGRVEQQYSKKGATIFRSYNKSLSGYYTWNAMWDNNRKGCSGKIYVSGQKCNVLLNVYTDCRDAGSTEF